LLIGWQSKTANLRAIIDSETVAVDAAKKSDYNYTAHIIRHAFQDMKKSSLINVVTVNQQ